MALGWCSLTWSLKSFPGDLEGYSSPGRGTGLELSSLITVSLRRAFDNMVTSMMIQVC